MKYVEAGLTGHLKIGVNFSAPFHSMTSELLTVFHQKYPHVKIELIMHEQQNLMQLTDIKNENLDLAFIWMDEGYEEQNIKKLNLAKNPLCAVLPGAHPLAKKESIHIQDIKDEPFISEPRDLGTQRYNGVMKAFESIDSYPRVVSEVLQMPLAMCLVASGQGVSLLPSFLERVSMPGVEFRPLILPEEETPNMILNLIGLKSTRNTIAHNFFDVASEFVETKS